MTGIDQDGTAFSFTFGDDPRENLNGENFFVAMTDAAQSIRSISFSGSAFTDIRQIRVGQNAAVAAVPEPATWAMMLLGFGAIGVSIRRRRNSRDLAQFA